MERIFAGLTSYLTVTFKDKDGAARAATSASYRIEDVDTGQEIRGDTAISPGAIVEITMMPSDNALVDDDKPSRCGA